MAGKQQEKEGGYDTEMKILAGAFVACLAIWVVWMVARKPIIWFMFGLDYIQITAVSFVRGLGERGSQMLNFITATFDGRVSPQSVSWDEVQTVSVAVGKQTHIFLFLIILGLAALCYSRIKTEKFKRVFSLAGRKGQGPSFREYQSHSWKTTIPGAQFDPDNATAADDPAKTPMEWLRDIGVSFSEERPLNDPEFEKLIERAFSDQLGTAWNGLMKAPIHVKAMAVMCGISAKRHPKNRAFKEELAAIWTLSKGPSAVAKTEKLLKPYLDDKALTALIDKKAAKHAFTNTAMFNLLDWARRKGGVLATAEFRWLKPVDRALWYTLNNCGRRAFHIEAAGAVCHFFAERVSQIPLTDPYVEEAIIGIEDYLEEHMIDNLEAFFNDEANAD